MRFTATSDEGWATTVRRTVGDVAAGGKEQVPVYVKVPAGTAPGARSTITLTATSETDAEVSEQATCSVAAARVAPPAARPAPAAGGSLPATGAEEAAALVALGLVVTAGLVRRRLRR